MAKAVVVIHGVGPAVPGVVGRAVATTLGYREARQTVVCVDGHGFVELVDQASGDAVIEVNWADLVQTKANVLGVLLHLCYVLTSMLDIAARGTEKYRAPLIRLYRICLLTITPGAVAFTLATAIAVAFDTRWQRVFLLALLLIAWVGIVWTLQRLGAHFRWLWPWVIVVALVGLASTVGPVPGNGFLAWMSLQVREKGFLIVFATLALAFVEAVGSPPRAAWAARLARGAFLYLPFIAMNSLMTWLGFVCLSLISRYGRHYSDWERTAAPRFDYAGIELVTTIVIGGIGIAGLALPLAGYACFRSRSDASGAELNHAGRGAQDGVRDFLVVAPIALIALGFFSIWLAQTTGPSTAGVLETYRNSIWRTVPYVAWFFGPFAVALDVVGDVLFYARPDDGHPAAIGIRCRERLQAALGYAVRKFGSNLMILAHSQGSVIASDLRLTWGLDVPLVTVGSPVHSLYRRFLGAEGGGAKIGAPWVNGYRDGDFIAGPIARDEVENVHMGPGGHTDYWKDPALSAVLARAQATRIW